MHAPVRPPALIRLHMTDGLALPGQPESDTAEVEVGRRRVEGVPTGSKVVAKSPSPVLPPKKRMGDEEGRPVPVRGPSQCARGHQHQALASWRAWCPWLLGGRGDSKSM